MIPSPASELAAVPAALEKALPSLGHAVVTWARATNELLNQIERGQSGFDWLAARRTHDLRLARPPGFAPGSSFELSLAIAEERWWISGCSEVQADAWSLMRWLLHLPGLSERWVRELRAERFERLRQSVPALWYVDDEEPPVGSVIAGLGAASWNGVRAALEANDGLEVVGSDRWIQRKLTADASVSASYAISDEGRVSMSQTARLSSPAA